MRNLITRLLLILVAFFGCYSTDFAQMRMVLNDGIFVVLDGSTKIVVDNPSPNSVTTTGSGGNIISETETNQLIWKIGTSTGTYVVPFTTSAPFIKIPLTASIGTAGIGAGEIRFSTYKGSTFDNLTYMPTGVTNMTDVSSGIINNSPNTIDRFWIIDPQNYTVNPDATIDFTYVDAEHLTVGNTICESGLKAQNYNSTTNLWSSLSGSANTTSNVTSGALVTSAEFNRAWTLASSPIVASNTTANVSCYGLADGFVLVASNGGSEPYNVSWTGTSTGDPIGTEISLNGGNYTMATLMEGSYTITVTDADGCTGATSASITQPTLLTNTISATDVTCNAGNEGSIDVSAMGGTESYHVSWVGASSGDPVGFEVVTSGDSYSITTLSAGSYDVTITDANGCTLTSTQTIIEPAPVTAIPTYSNISCNGEADGSIAIIATDGVSSYDVSWTGISSGDPVGTEIVTSGDIYNMNGLIAGAYDITVTDACGSIYEINLVLSEPALITSTLIETACDSYTLNGDVYTSSGTYTQLLSAINGCDSLVTLDLTIDLTPIGVITQVDAITLQAFIGTTYQWIDCDSGLDIAGETNQLFVATQNGNYAVAVSNGNCETISDCAVIDEVSLTENPLWNVQLFPNPATSQFNVVFTGIESVDVTICDAHGKQVIATSEVLSGGSIPLNHLESGVYFVKIKTPFGISINRLVKH